MYNVINASAPLYATLAFSGFWDFYAGPEDCFPDYVTTAVCT
jgi:hypothetical protein